MLRFRNLSIRAKQVLIIMLISSVTLLLACAAFIAFDTITFRQKLIEKESTVAEVLGNTVTAAIDFNDRKTAEESLAALRVEPNIVAGCIYDRDHAVFATYQRETDGKPFAFPPGGGAGHSFAGNQLHLALPIKQGEEIVGTIFIVSDLDELSRRLASFAGIVALVFLASLLIALALSSRLQRLISNPIRHLAQVARAVAVEKNYSARAAKQSGDELGELVDGFNEMLAQIQERDAALQGARDTLEKRVEERTRELQTENTERRRAEEALRESQALYHSLVEQMPIGVFRKDKEGRYVFVNPWFCRLKKMKAEQFLGHRPDEIIATQLSQSKDAAQSEKIKLNFQGADHHKLIIKDGRQIEVEEHYPNEGDKEQYLHVLKSPVVGPGGSIIGSQGILIDITQRKLAERALLESQALYLSLVEQLPVGVFRKNLEGRYVFVNPWFCRIKGVPAEKFLGKTPEELAAHELAEPAAQVEEIKKLASQGVDHHQMIVRTGGQIELEEKYHGADGREQHLHVLKSPVFGPNGAIIGSQGILIDITQRKEAEMELVKVHRQLIDASRQAGMAEVATGVLHNVGNVLNSVNVATSLLTERVKTSKVPYIARIAGMLREHAQDLGDYLTQDPKGQRLPSYIGDLAEHLADEQKAALTELAGLHKNIEHIKDIVAMQQNYARVAGVTQTVKIAEVVEDALRMNEGALTRHDVKLIREIDPQLPEVIIDRHKVLQILVNLIRNAKYACTDSGFKDKRMIVRVASIDGRIRISVVDNGIGIPTENLNRIFNHGFTTRKSGHGFGLHSGALAAKEMGGALVVHSEGPGKGATFTLDLPLRTSSGTS